ncbi:MAG: glycosyltransferase [Syntrophothermus sp.]
MFKVLVIAYYFPPMGLSSVLRTAKFVKYMKKYNWEPTVITTGKPGYLAYDQPLLKEIEDNQIRVIRTEENGTDAGRNIKIPNEGVRKVLSRLSKTFFIPDNKAAWAAKAYEAAKDLLEKEEFDIIYVSIPPFSSFSMAAKLSKQFDISLFVDYRDLWTGNRFAFNPTPFHKYKHKKLEYRALKVADKIITTNRKIKEKLLGTFQFLTFEDILILPQGFDPEDFEAVKPIPKENNKMRLTYTGVFYENISPKYFLQAFRKLAYERPDVAQNIELHFIGHLRKENIKLINKLSLQPFVKDSGYLDHHETIRRMVSSDVLWMMIGKGTNSDSVSTGKLFEYFGSRKPVLASVPDGAAKMAAQEYGAAFITEPDNIEQIKNAILMAHTLYKTGKFPVPNEDFIQKLRRDLLTEQLTKTFQFYMKAV